MFECVDMYTVWKRVLQWLQMEHEPKGWAQELEWIQRNSKGKGRRCVFLKTAFAETVYRCWRYRNNKVHGTMDARDTAEDIIDTVVHRLWRNTKNREQIAQLLLI